MVTRVMRMMMIRKMSKKIVTMKIRLKNSSLRHGKPWMQMRIR